MRFFKSVMYAFKGIKLCIRSEKNFHIQLFVLFIIILCGFIFNISNTDWIVLLICSEIVLSLEMINTSIEKLADVLVPVIHPEIKK